MAQHAPDHRLEEPHRTPGKAEGCDMDVDDADNPYLHSPIDAECHPRTQEEPDRTPGKAEG